MNEDRNLTARDREFDSPQIGPIDLWPPVILAPMAGVTDVPFRDLCRSFMREGLEKTRSECLMLNSTPGLFVNQMITARAFLERNKKTLKLAEFGYQESPRSIQLLSLIHISEPTRPY